MKPKPAPSRVVSILEEPDADAAPTAPGLTDPWSDRPGHLDGITVEGSRLLLLGWRDRVALDAWTAGERRLEDVGRVDGALGRTGTDQGVQPRR